VSIWPRFASATGTTDVEQPRAAGSQLDGVSHGSLWIDRTLLWLAYVSATRKRAATSSLARRIDWQSLLAVHLTNAMPDLVSRRPGCLVHYPVYGGV
jgi:hypothetical protein